MAKPFDPKAKAKRQKIIAGVLGLVLVGVLVFQAPKILEHVRRRFVDDRHRAGRDAPARSGCADACDSRSSCSRDAGRRRRPARPRSWTPTRRRSRPTASW